MGGTPLKRGGGMHMEKRGTSVSRRKDVRSVGSCVNWNEEM